MLNYDEYVIRNVKVPKEGKPLFRTVTDSCKIVSTIVGIITEEQNAIHIQYIDPEMEGALIEFNKEVIGVVQNREELVILLEG